MSTDTDGIPLEIAEDLADIDFGLPQPFGIEIAGFHEHLARIQRTTRVEPVWFVQGSPAWLVTGYDNVLEAFKDTGTFSPRATQEMFTFPVTGPMMLGFEGREHTLHRKIVSPRFTKRASREYLEPTLRPQAQRIVSDLQDRDRFDLMEEFGKKFPLAIIADLLGIPADDNWDEAAGWAQDILFGPDPTTRADSAQAFADYARRFIELRRNAPDDDLLTALVNADLDGVPLTEDQIVSFLLLLFPAGVDTTWLSIGTMFTAILSTPGVVEKLRDDPSLRPDAVEETLRWEGPIALQPRRTVEETTVDGVVIPAGSLTLLAIAAANRDPDRYDDPQAWDLDRRPTDHLAFSFGEHYCLGSHLARAEMLVALDVVLDRFPQVSLAEPPAICGGTIRGPREVLLDVGR